MCTTSTAMAVKLKKVASEQLTEEIYHVGRWSRGHTSRVRQRNHNLGQKVGDKFSKLSKLGFSMERFAADNLRYFTKNHQNLVFWWTAGYSLWNLSISGIFLNFPNFLRSLSLKSLGNSWVNSYIHFLVIKTEFHFENMAKTNCTKKWKSSQMFCPRLSENFPFNFYLFKNALKPPKWSVFSR